MSDPVFEVKDLVMSYAGQTVLDVERLSILPGETLTLVGHNGSGKSTLMRILGLLTRPTRGRIRFEGEEVSYRSSQLLAMRRRMAAVLQEPLLCRMSVYHNVALGLRFRGITGREVEQRVGKWLERLRIDHLRKRRAQGLSGGEAQRTSLARALVLEPDVLFLDEPFAALDTPTRHALLKDFEEILSETRITTLFTTHDRGEALTMGDRVAVISSGRIAQLGESEEIFRRPATEEVARFVGVENLIPGRVTAYSGSLVSVDIGGNEVEVHGAGEADMDVLVGLRPEDLTLTADPSPPSTDARNRLAGKIVRVVPSESHLKVVLDCGFPLVALVTRATFRELKRKDGQPITVEFSPADAHLIHRAEREAADDEEDLA